MIKNISYIVLGERERENIWNVCMCLFFLLILNWVVKYYILILFNCL